MDISKGIKQGLMEMDPIDRARALQAMALAVKPFKAEVQTGSDPKWYGNGLDFATAAEAETYVIDLFHRWTAVVKWRVVKVTPKGRRVVKVMA